LNIEEVLILFLPKKKTVKVPLGTNLIEAADKAGIIIPSLCASRGKCGKCKVKILEDVIPYTSEEEITLSPEDRSLGIHLACQVNITTNLSVEIISEEKATTTQFLTYDLSDKIKVDTQIKKIYLEMEKPDINNQVDDYSTLNKNNKLNKNIFTPLPILQNLPTFLRKNDFKATFVIDEFQFISYEAGDTTERLFGVAFDLGTTTIVGSLIDMLSGNILGIKACTNPQSKQGEDVISRVNYATSEPGGLVKLQTEVIEAINGIIEDLCAQANVDFREIYEMSLAGNTIMNHLFLGVTPHFIAETPYIPAFRKCQQFRAEELGITIQARGTVSTLPNISGYVGGDITGFILASNIFKSDKIILGIDVGTNGEIVLGSKQRLLSCSAAAGPAFEGGHISHGMRAMEGAIDKCVFEQDQPFFHVIGDVEPKGICGTGLIDVLAELLKFGIIDLTGKLDLQQSKEIPQWIRDRVIKTDKGNSFNLMPKNKSSEESQLLITQQDIREVQLGKGAIAAGITILCKELGISISDIEKVLIAGAFGSYLNKYNAQKIGLIPNVSSDRINFVGNAASLGAKKFLLSKKARKDTDKIINFVEYIELSMRKDFQDVFAESMLFE
jgi:uncharacterized 2Fe-2S/4Fe-4S cluster protein (DUF4445 family)